MSTKRKSNANLSYTVPSKKLTPNGHWSLGLLRAMEDPNLVVKSDDKIVIIKDCHPKAEFHYLVLPRENISSLKSVTKEHRVLLEYMHKAAKDLVNEDKHKSKIFKLGYHAEPSMVRLHLHVISDDMNSSCLKHKKHWNSFTTKFFLNSEDILKSLETNDKVVLPSKEDIKKWIGTPLQCHKCDYKPKNFPDLKTHILKHL